MELATTYPALRPVVAAGAGLRPSKISSPPLFPGLLLNAVVDVVFVFSIL